MAVRAPILLLSFHFQLKIPGVFFKEKKRTGADLSSFKRHFNKSRCLAWLTLHRTAVPGWARAADTVPGSQEESRKAAQGTQEADDDRCPEA